MSPTTPLAEAPPAEAVRRIALAELGRVREAAARAARASGASDSEGLHDFRAALRRLRTTLKLWKDELGGSVRRRDRRALRDLQAATGAGRDAEVGLAWLAARRAQHAVDSPELRAGLELVESGLRERAAATARSFAENLPSDLASLSAELEPRLARYEARVDLARSEPETTFAAALAARARAQVEVLLEALRTIEGPNDRAAQHAARIEAKRLRYLCEPAIAFVAPAGERARELVDELKRLQDVLGRTNDAHVLSDSIVAIGAAKNRRPATVRAGLAELTWALDSERERLFRELETPWLAEARGRAGHAVPAVPESPGGRLAALTANLAGALEVRAPAVAGETLEIERKYLLSGRPRLPQGAEVLEIEQGWLPGKRLRERLRRTTRPTGTTFHRALKLGRGLVRTEIEEETTRELFDALWPLTAGCRVLKRRYRIADGAFTWEIDEFTDRELWLAEVELPASDTRTELPAWLAPFVVREVTDERGYTNLELAR